MKTRQGLEYLLPTLNHLSKTQTDNCLLQEFCLLVFGESKEKLDFYWPYAYGSFCSWYCVWVIFKCYHGLGISMFNFLSGIIRNPAVRSGQFSQESKCECARILCAFIFILSNAQEHSYLSSVWLSWKCLRVLTLS